MQLFHTGCLCETTRGTGKWCGDARIKETVLGCRPTLKRRRCCNGEGFRSSESRVVSNALALCWGASCRALSLSRKMVPGVSTTPPSWLEEKYTDGRTDERTNEQTASPPREPKV
jgi:hypothetical protein